MTTRIQLRRGTASQWTSADPTLALGEAGIETDTLLWKVGDGVTSWSELPYMESANENFGNVTVTGNAVVGNLLTDNYLYANGTPVTFGANTGDITFNASTISTNAANTDITIQGNGTGPINIVTNANSYTQLQNDSATNGSSYVYLENGNVVVETSTGTWVFDSTGNLISPSDSLTIDSGYYSGTPGLVSGSGGGLRNTQLYSSGNVASEISLARPGFPTAGDNFVQIALHEDNANDPNIWTFNKTGDLTFPDNSGAEWPINTQRFGMGNIGAWLDGQWTIGEFSGNSVSGAVGIRIDPAIEGYTGITLPGSESSNTQPVQIYSTNGSGIELYTGVNNWVFDSNGDINIPAGSNSFDEGRIQSANGYPTLLGYGSGGHGGPELDWMDGDNVNDMGNSSVLRNTMYINDSGLYIGMNENEVANVATASWRFEPNGNLTLPIGTPSINYANGQPYGGGSGGNANTGNVTFDNINIIGTGNLHLQPDPANSSAYLDIYLTASPGPDIHIAGNGENVIIGRDTGANVTVDAYGNVSVQTWDGAANTWTFGSNGTFTTPGESGNITGANVVSANTFAIAGNTTLNQVEGANTAGFYNADPIEFLFELGPNTWNFNGNTGGTGFPTLSTQRGDNPSGTITGQTLLFGDSTQEAVISTPNGTSSYNSSQRLVINPGEGYPGSGGEGGDIYLWAGRGGSASGSGGDIKIRGGQGGANTDGGNGGDGGYIRIEAGDAASTGGYAGYIDITGGTSNAVGGYVTITGGSGQTQGGDANINGGYTNTGPGGRVNINGGGSGSGLSQYGNVNIVSGASTWTFDNTGNLTAPGAVSAVGNVIGGNITTGGIANLYSVRMSQGISWPDYNGSEIYEDGGLVINGPGGLFATGNIAAQFEFNDGLGNSSGLYSDANSSILYGNTYTIVRSNNAGGGGYRDWTFDVNGTLTTPSLTAPLDRLYYGLTFTYGAATIDFVLNADGTFSDVVCANGGGGYSASSGSLVMPGTQLLNGASPANDITWDYVCAANDGVITSFTYASGTPPTYYNSIESGLDIGISANSNVWTFGQNGTLTIPGAVHSQVDNNLNFKVYNANNTGGSSFGVQNFQVDIDAVTTKFDVGVSDITLTTDFNDVGYTWNFDNTGNLTLPGNTFAVNYANGNPVTFSGGSGNTGNVTFSDQAVVGTGDQEGGSGLYLAPGTESVGNLQYLRVRGGDYPTHIHLDTGNNAYFDQYFGDDNKYVQLSNTGNIVINANDMLGNSHQWSFDYLGTMYIPGNIKVDAGNDLDVKMYNPTAGGHVSFTVQNRQVDISNAVTTQFDVNGNAIVLSTDVNNANYQWTFDDTGNLTAPGVVTASEFSTSGSGGDITMSSGNITGVNKVTTSKLTVAGNITVGGSVNGALTLFTGAITGNVLTVTGATDGTISWGQTLYGNSVAAETVITSQLTFTSANAGGNGTYRLNQIQTVGAESMYVNSLYTDGDLKLAADHGIYVRDAHDPYLYDNLIGVTEPDATVFIGSLNTNGVTIDNNKEYKVDSAINPGTYMAVAKVDVTDNVILGSGNANTTQIRVGGDSATGYAIKFQNGGEALIPTGLRIGDNTNSTIFNAPLEISSILGAEANNQSRPSGIGMPTYRGTGNIIANDEWGSYLYGSRYRGTINSPLPTKDGDWLMEFGATSFDGTNNNGGGEMAFRVDGTVTGTANPSRWELYVTPAGANSQALGLKVDSTLATTAYGPVITPPTALANLTAVAGARAFVNNGNLVAVGNFGAQIGSGGANVVPVWSDGTNWYIG